MAYFRQIYTTFWTDSKVVDDFTPEDKYFYLYLLTNAHTNLCGCYEISKRQMSNDTGYTVDVVERLLGRLSGAHNVIRYDDETKELLLVNWHKYNWSKSDKLLKGVENEVAQLKSPEFRELLTEILVSLEYPIDRVSPLKAYPMDTSYSYSNTDSNNSSFERFWQAYPKKVGKQDARRAFKRAQAQTTADAMISAVEAQKKSGQWTRDNGRYIPNPSTWLNQGRWEDDIQPLDKKPRCKTAPSEEHEYDMDDLRRRAKE